MSAEREFVRVTGVMAGIKEKIRYFGFEPKGEIQFLQYQRKLKKACADAGLAGKEARAPVLLLGFICGKAKKKQP